MSGYALVIGSGSIGERHANNLSKFFDMEVEVLSRKPSLEFRKNSLNANKGVKKISIEELSLNKNIDVIVMATPSSIRLSALSFLESIEAKNLYVEVPAAVNFKCWEELKTKAIDRNISISAGYNMRYHPGIRKIFEIKEKTKFYSLRAIFGEFLPALHTWQDYRERYEARKDLGGGPLLTSHHELDIAIAVLGEIDSVSCNTNNTRLDIDAPDHAILYLHHIGGEVSTLDLNFFYRKYTRRIEIACEEDILIYEPFSSGVIYQGEVLESYKDYDFNRTYIEAMRDALAESPSKSKVKLEEVDHLLRVTDACLASANSYGIMTKV